MLLADELELDLATSQACLQHKQLKPRQSAILSLCTPQSCHFKQVIFLSLLQFKTLPTLLGCILRTAAAMATSTMCIAQICKLVGCISSHNISIVLPLISGSSPSLMT